MRDDFYGVVMAGGEGTRLWPVSRSARPKQGVQLFGDRTLFQLAIDRLLPMMPAANILVATVRSQATLLRSQAPMLRAESFLLEPAQRGTASVVGLAAVVLRRRDPDAVMACVTADHHIQNVDRFRQVLRAAYEVARDGELVTLGIEPTFPAQGYGYIQRGELLGRYGGFDTYRVRRFKEKPGLTEAESYLASGGYSWNSGMFVWKAQRILEEIERLMPDLHQALRAIDLSWGKPGGRKVLEQCWMSLKKQTVDYGIMEQAKRTAVIPAEGLGWLDIGGWDKLFEILTPDEEGNLRLAKEICTQDTRDVLVFADPKASKARLIATLGIHGLVIVDTEDVLLVCSRERAEDVRGLVERVRNLGLDRYL